MTAWRSVGAGRALAAALLGASCAALAQALPNPYRMVRDWAHLPAGRAMGAVGDLALDPDQRHLWAVIRCDAGADKSAMSASTRSSTRS
jgi:hypothetical protein